jgi:hypothetical protein
MQALGRICAIRQEEKTQPEHTDNHRLALAGHGCRGPDRRYTEEATGSHLKLVGASQNQFRDAAKFAPLRRTEVPLVACAVSDGNRTESPVSMSANL